MITRPTTDTLIGDCCRELTDAILPGLTDETLRLRLVMTETVLRNAAVRAAHEIAWMREETSALEAYAAEVAARHGSEPLRAALAADPDSAQAKTLLGLSYYGTKRFDLALRLLAPLAEAEPENAELHQILAQSCLWAKNNACALEQFRQLLGHNPDSAETHILTGEALDGLSRTEEAIAELETAAKISPRLPNVHFGLGYLYWKTQQYERAKKEFDLELEIDSASAQALAYLGDIEWKNDRPEPAISFLTRAAKISPSLRIVETDLGAIYLQQKKYKSAETALLRAVGLDPRQPDAHYQLARLYQALGDKAAAG